MNTALNKSESIFYIDYLTLPAMLTHILPFILRKYGFNLKSIKCFVFDHRAGWEFDIIKRISCVFGMKIEKILFRMVDVQNEEGIGLRLRLVHGDACEMRDNILEDHRYKDIISGLTKHQKALKVFLSKSLIHFNFGTYARAQSIFHALLFIDVISWYHAKNQILSDKNFFIRTRQWQQYINKHARAQKVNLILLPYCHFFLYGVIKSVRSWYLFFYMMFKKIIYGFYYFLKSITEKQESNKEEKNVEKGPLLSVDHYGQFNLDHPELNSELFFYHQSGLSEKEMMLLFMDSQEPLDKEKVDILSREGFSALALFPKAIRCCHPKHIYYPWHFFSGMAENALEENHFGSLEGNTILNNIKDFYSSYTYWIKVLTKHNIKVHTTWYKGAGHHIPLAQALDDLGGVMTIYQKSFIGNASPSISMYTDVYFSFSNLHFDIEKANHSKISHFIVTGYLGDHRINLLRKNAAQIRKKLLSHGAKKIVTFFDENTIEDGRWCLDHKFTQANYAFILEKVLADDTIGLVIKPKNPGTLWKRLGPVALLLKKLQDTGRCYFFGQEKGKISGYPPAYAALASDLVISEVLSGGTAACESALAGIPTIFLDQEGWPLSPLYQLSHKKVIYKDINKMWSDCREYFKGNISKSEFGNWDDIIDKIDPFRDGLAAQRMGDYLKVVIDGINNKEKKKFCLERASEMYAKRWGKDKVLCV